MREKNDAKTEFPRAKKRILGIDPGTVRCGYGVVDFWTRQDFSVREWGIIASGREKKLGDRLSKIYARYFHLLEAFAPDLVAIEELFFVKNIRTGMSVAEVRGLIIALTKIKKIPVIQFKPTTVKQTITGYGRASKAQMQKMVKLRLKLSQTPKPDDCADALAIAFTAFVRNGF